MRMPETALLPCMLPSKTFNLAGLVGSYHIIYNKYLRDRVQAKGSKSHYNEMNLFPCMLSWAPTSRKAL